MESKHTNPNGEIVLVKKLNSLWIYFFQLFQLELYNESNTLFLPEDAMIAHKTRSSATSTLVIHME